MSQIYLLSLVVALASAFALAVRKFKQPLIVSYIAAGAILSAFHIVKPEQLEFLKFLPEIGLAFLLFLVGMELDLKEFAQMGKTIIIAALAQITVTTLLLTGIAAYFGITGLSAIVMGLSLSFSSTILVIKLLIEKKEIYSLHGKLAVGILLLEDLVAILVLMLLTIVGSKTDLSFLPFALIFLKGLGLIGLSIFLGKYLLPKIFSWTAESTELLFLTSIAWCLIFVSISQAIGFSSGIGAFLAGVSLAQSTFRIQITGKIKPLRDFFIMVFFIDLGSNLSFSSVGSHLGLGLAILAYEVLIKPFVFNLLFISFKFKAKTAFDTAIYLSSISEFSLIVLFLAGQTGLFDPSLTSTIIFATVCSFVFSSLVITHSRVIYSKTRSLLKLIERKSALNFDFLPSGETSFKDHAILIGCHTSGQVILKSLKRIYEDRVLVVDFNPDVVTELKNQGVYCIYGDITDPEILEKIDFKDAQLIISTIRDLTSNFVVLDQVEKVQSKAAVVMTASNQSEAIKLYEKGAHHVSVPFSLEGSSIGRLLSDYHKDWKDLISEREKKLGELKKN